MSHITQGMLLEHSTKGRWPAMVPWCLYDWASSSFSVVITTFVFAAYFTESVASDTVRGTVLWGRAMAVAGLFIAIFSALLGTVSDLKGERKRWLMAAVALGVGATGSLWFVRPEVSSVPLALIGIVVAVIAFEIGAVFYNALLPLVAPSGYLGRISGWGNCAGAFGGITCLGAVLLLFVLPADTAPFGLDPHSQQTTRICMPFVALWWLVFSLPLFLLLKEAKEGAAHSWKRAFQHGAADLVSAIRALPREPRVMWYLLAQMLYSDGLNTLLAFSGIFAAGTFGLDVSDLLIYGIVVNISVGFGSCGFGWVDDRLGAKSAVAIGLSGMIVFVLAIILTESTIVFWLCSILVGVFLGPVQASSRSLMAGMTRPENRAQMFGLYAVSGKVTAFLGPALFSVVTDISGNQRAGMAVTVPFFAAGLILLLWAVKEESHSINLENRQHGVTCRHTF